MRGRTALVLLVIGLAAVAGVAYGSYRANEDTKRLERRVALVEAAGRETSREIEALKADKASLCTGVDRAQEKITGIVLTPGSPTPEFDLGAGSLNDTARVILTFYNWCHASD